MKDIFQERTGSVTAAPPDITQLLGDVTLLIDSTRQRVARTVNAELVLMYWKIGARIRQDILGGERAAYGEQIVSTLSRQLTASHGVGFSRGNLFHNRKRCEVEGTAVAERAIRRNFHQTP